MRRINYRHYICIGITLAFMLCSIFIFNDFYFRLLTAIKDFWNSIVYYFVDIFKLDYKIDPTIINAPTFPDIPGQPSQPGGVDPPTIIIPNNFDLFKVKISMYFDSLFNLETLGRYLNIHITNLIKISRLLLFLIPLIIMLKMYFKNYFEKQNNNYNKDSKPLKIFKKLSDKLYRPTKLFIKSFISFVKINYKYFHLWLWIWLLNFNIISIIISFLAFYFYFVVSLDVLNIYMQVYKIFLDLSVMFKFIPLIFWLVLFLIIIDKCLIALILNCLF